MSYFQSQTQPYYLIPRKRIRKRTVYYYHVHGENRKVIGEWSTCQTNRFRAESYCRDLLQAGKLIPTARKKRTSGNSTLFKDYFADWYDYDKCPYIQKKLKAGKSYSRSNASIQRSNLEKYLLPTFGSRPKHLITLAEIEDWLFIKN